MLINQYIKNRAPAGNPPAPILISSHQTDEQLPLKDIGLNFHRIRRNPQQVFWNGFERRPQIVQILRRNLPGNYHPKPVLTVRGNETIQRIEFCFLFRHSLNPVQHCLILTQILKQALARTKSVTLLNLDCHMYQSFLKITYLPSQQISCQIKLTPNLEKKAEPRVELFSHKHIHLNKQSPNNFP